MNYLINISLNHYDPSFGPIDLKMCHYDTDRIFLAFPDGYTNILLRDNNANAATILDALSGVAKAATKGDNVYVYFSGHGTYWDTPTGRKTGRLAYDRVIWDDEIITALQAFAAGVTVVMCSDCCFAESNSRLVPDTNVRIRYTATKAAPPKPWVVKKPSLRCTLYALSASSITQTAKELGSAANGIDQGGVFTSALVKVLTYRPDTSLRQLTKAIQANIPARFEQTIKLEYVNGRKGLSNSFMQR